MKRNIKLNDTDYPEIEQILLKDTDGADAVFTETSDATATEKSILEGQTAFVNGSKITGAMKLIEKTITENGAYEASDDNASGYSKIIAEISNGFNFSSEFTQSQSGTVVLAEDRIGISNVNTGLSVPIKFACIFADAPKNSYTSWVYASFYLLGENSDEIKIMLIVDEDGNLQTSTADTAFSVSDGVVKLFGKYDTSTFWMSGVNYKWFVMG